MKCFSDLSTDRGRLYCCLLLLCVHQRQRVRNRFNVAEATPDHDFPTPAMSACKYSQLRFSHIDDIFGTCKRKGDDGDIESDHVVDTDSLWGGAAVDGDSASSAYEMAAWEHTISHGWVMAEALERGEESSVQTDSAFIIGEREERDGAVAPEIRLAYPFLACLHTETASSGYDNLRDLLPLVGAISSHVVVLSNRVRTKAASCCHRLPRLLVMSQHPCRIL